MTAINGNCSRKRLKVGILFADEQISFDRLHEINNTHIYFNNQTQDTTTNINNDTSNIKITIKMESAGIEQQREYRKKLIISYYFS